MVRFAGVAGAFGVVTRPTLLSRRWCRQPVHWEPAVGSEMGCAYQLRVSAVAELRCGDDTGDSRLS